MISLIMTLEFRLLEIVYHFTFPEQTFIFILQFFFQVALLLCLMSIRKTAGKNSLILHLNPKIHFLGDK